MNTIINNFINKINPRQFFIASIIIIVVDYFALQLFLAPLFKEFIPNIQNKPMKFKLIPAIIAYFFIAFAFYYFIIANNASILDAFLLGLSIYGIYEATNMAILDNWPIKALIADTLWGGSLFAISTFIFRSFTQISNKFFP